MWCYGVNKVAPGKNSWIKLNLESVMAKEYHRKFIILFIRNCVCENKHFLLTSRKSRCSKILYSARGLLQKTSQESLRLCRGEKQEQSGRNLKALRMQNRAAWRWKILRTAHASGPVSNAHTYRMTAGKLDSAGLHEREPEVGSRGGGGTRKSPLNAVFKKTKQPTTLQQLPTAESAAQSTPTERQRIQPGRLCASSRYLCPKKHRMTKHVLKNSTWMGKILRDKHRRLGSEELRWPLWYFSTVWSEGGSVFQLLSRSGRAVQRDRRGFSSDHICSLPCF